jgi:uncharacterized protein with NRDE domain
MPSLSTYVLLEHNYQARHQYGLFNLLVGDAHGIHYITNGMSPAQTELPHGIYGMSNALLDSPWGKLLRGMLPHSHAFAHFVSR